MVRFHRAADRAWIQHVAAQVWLALQRAGKNESSAAISPRYQLIPLFGFFVGFAANLKVPGLKGADIDLSLLRRYNYRPAVDGLQLRDPVVSDSGSQLIAA